MRRPRSNEPHRSLAALLREARTSYLLAVRPTLALWGFENMPRDGVFALSAIRDCDASAADLGRKMGVSKQAVSQLLDTLVARGYLERSVDTIDRRRTRLKLTRRGARAASVCREAVDRVERQLVERVGARYVEHTRATLAVLIGLAAGAEPVMPLSMAR